MLEDDEAFNEIVREFLVGRGFDVVPVANGVEGVRAITRSDFEVIICDMMMPSLPGDMFYLAVQRMRPHLCRRFIFITGHRGNERIDAFVRRVNGIMLNKPFRIEDLVELIGFVQIRSMLALG